MSSGGVVVLELPLGAAEEESFELEKAVCSHGLFMMPPNQWDPVSKTLLRPLRLGDSDSESVMVRISQHQWAPHSLYVRVYCHNSSSLSRQHRESVLAQVSRMLRLSEDEERAVREFRNMYNNEKKESSFVGRVFRSPTLFEDMVKCMLLCNCHPTELANLDEGFLASRCNLGYRASRILKLARDIVEGRIQLTQLEEASKGASFAKSSNYDKLAKQLKEIDGFGNFTCANVLMCMGYYHVIPTDSETIRHLRKVHARNSTVQTVQRDIERVYGKYAPFQFLAYWSELWHFYEKMFGKLSEMPCSDYKLITASNMGSTSSTKKRKKKC
ncbi:uncharacterized protein LOC111994442 isoform X4 [Quercus suber]|uniref:uncharacterized protein LOC111994442 isoform X4 n=1 Tax=Quercus suber TaxID=58331 RepID=UPI000CE258EB|nr:uncharacterized protein LOC111994442 isoform X5 [Quercus suber]